MKIGKKLNITVTQNELALCAGKTKEKYYKMLGGKMFR